MIGSTWFDDPVSIVVEEVISLILGWGGNLLENSKWPREF